MDILQQVLPGFKRCSKCGTVKPVDGFYRRGDGQQEYRSQCKPCQNETNKRTLDPVARRERERRAYANDPAHFRATQKRYRDRRAERLGLPRRRFYASGEERRRAFCDASRRYRIAHPEKVREGVRRWTAQNADRIRESARRYYYANREQARETNRRWHQNNRERSRQISRRSKHLRRNAPGFYTHEQFNARWDYYGGLCWLCGEPANTIDHVIPVSSGGTNWPANLRPACQPCNSGKRDRDWRTYRRHSPE